MAEDIKSIIKKSSEALSTSFVFIGKFANYRDLIKNAARKTGNYAITENQKAYCYSGKRRLKMANLKPKKVYISGKMRGMDEQESRAKFKAAEAMLTYHGYEVINPWNDEEKKKKACKKWEDFIIYDLKVIKRCDVIYMLDNWEDSWGAKCEYAFANGRNMEILFEKDV